MFQGSGFEGSLLISIIPAAADRHRQVSARTVNKYGIFLESAENGRTLSDPERECDGKSPIDGSRPTRNQYSSQLFTV